MRKLPATKYDPVELELFRHLFTAIAEEMGIVLRKTAYSANIKERRDYSCALYDAAGRTIAMGDHMPVHLGAMPLSVRHAIDAHRFEPGDVVILNDPFRGGTHLPDITAVAGVFLRGKKRPSFYVASRAHHADVGGMSPGSMPLAREIYQEGIRIPPIALVRQDRIDEPLLALLLSNVRTPEERRGDLMAQAMSMKRGALRLTELCARYGAATVNRNVTGLLEYSARMMRHTLAALPAGIYHFEDFLDGDGVDAAAGLRIAVSVELRGSEAVVDFTGTSPQAAGPVNANYAVALSATAYVFRCLIAEDVPFTAGLMEPVTVIAPEGTLVNARPPAAMAAGNVETSQRITDTVLGALAQAAPDRIPAASSGTMNNLTFGGWDRSRNRPFAYYETIAGGMGGGPVHRGQSAVHTHMTNSWNTPVEALERQYPIRIGRYAVRRGSGGKGLHPGGDGIIREYEFLEETDVTVLADRRLRAPYGLNGGSAGACGRTSLEYRDESPGTSFSGDTIALAPKDRKNVRAGGVLRVETPGGGGWGAVDDQL